MDAKNLMAMALLGLLVWVLVNPSATARDGGGGDADRGIIAVTGSYGSNASALYLIDTKTRHMAAYRLDNGRSLEFVAAREFSYDLHLETYNDSSAPGYLPGALRRAWQRFRGQEPAGKGFSGGDGAGETEQPGGFPRGPTYVPLGGSGTEGGR